MSAIELVLQTLQIHVNTEQSIDLQQQLYRMFFFIANQAISVVNNLYLKLQNTALHTFMAWSEHPNLTSNKFLYVFIRPKNSRYLLSTEIAQSFTPSEWKNVFSMSDCA